MSELKFFSESSIRNLEICITSISGQVRDGKLTPEAAESEETLKKHLS